MFLLQTFLNTSLHFISFVILLTLLNVFLSIIPLYCGRNFPMAEDPQARYLRKRRLIPSESRGGKRKEDMCFSNFHCNYVTSERAHFITTRHKQLNTKCELLIHIPSICTTKNKRKQIIPEKNFAFRSIRLSNNKRRLNLHQQQLPH